MIAHRRKKRSSKRRGGQKPPPQAPQALIEACSCLSPFKVAVPINPPFDLPPAARPLPTIPENAADVKTGPAAAQVIAMAYRACLPDPSGRHNFHTVWQTYSGALAPAGAPPGFRAREASAGAKPFEVVPDLFTFSVGVVAPAGEAKMYTCTGAYPTIRIPDQTDAKMVSDRVFGIKNASSALAPVVVKYFRADDVILAFHLSLVEVTVLTVTWYDRNTSNVYTRALTKIEVFEISKIS